MFHRTTFGERLENEEMHNIKVSGSRGSREMTFVIGKVYLLSFNLITDRKMYFLLYYLLFSYFFCRENIQK